ncbi:MAG: hypothetical protein LBK92_01275 [Endomicrobium sp.]|nr:hypothetical protein [Endomicrobium sp.]
MRYIDIKYPQLKDLYHDIYIAKNMGYWEWLEREIVRYCQEHDIKHSIFFYHSRIKKKSTSKKHTQKSMQLGFC